MRRYSLHLSSSYAVRDVSLVLSPGGDFEYEWHEHAYDYGVGFSASGRWKCDGSKLELHVISTQSAPDRWAASSRLVGTIERGRVSIDGDELSLESGDDEPEPVASAAPLPVSVDVPIAIEIDTGHAYRSAAREPERDFFRPPSGRRYSCEELSSVMELGLRDDGCFVFHKRSGTKVTAIVTGTYREQDGWLVLFVEKVSGFVFGLWEGQEAKLPYRTGAYILDDRYALGPD